MLIINIKGIMNISCIVAHPLVFCVLNAVMLCQRMNYLVDAGPMGTIETNFMDIFLVMHQLKTGNFVTQYLTLFCRHLKKP